MKIQTLNIIPNKYINANLLVMMKLCPKLILTGTSSLYSLGLITRKPNDLDFALSSPLTPEELMNFKDFFGLSSMEDEGYEYNQTIGKKKFDPNNKIPFNPEGAVKRKILQLKKIENEETICKIDIFNHEYLRRRDIIKAPYLETANDENLSYRMIDVAHPSITIGYKTRLALDDRVGGRIKHLEDVRNITNHPNYNKFIEKTSLWMRNQSIIKGNDSELERDDELIDLPF